MAEQIKINELVTQDISLTDLVIKADGNGNASKNTVEKLLEFAKLNGYFDIEGASAIYQVSSDAEMLAKYNELDGLGETPIDGSTLIRDDFTPFQYWLWDSTETNKGVYSGRDVLSLATEGTLLKGSTDVFTGDDILKGISAQPYELSQTLTFDEDKVLNTFNDSISIFFNLSETSNLKGKVIRAEIGENVTSVKFGFPLIGVINGSVSIGVTNIIYFMYVDDGVVDISITEGNRRAFLLDYNNIDFTVKLDNTNLPSEDSEVSIWTDQSGNSKNATQKLTSANNPVVKNGNVFFDGDEILSINAYDITNSNNKCSVFFNYTPYSSSGGRTIIGQFSTVSNQRLWRVWTNGLEVVFNVYDTNGFTLVKDYRIDLESTLEEYRLGFTFSNGEFNIYKNGYKVDNSLVNITLDQDLIIFPTSETLDITIGNYINNGVLSGDNSLRGELSKVLIKDEVLSIDEIYSL